MVGSDSQSDASWSQAMRDKLRGLKPPHVGPQECEQLLQRKTDLVAKLAK